MFAFLFAGCQNLGGELIVGERIQTPEIKDFYYTVSTSTNPPDFWRYRYYKDGDKWVFHYEKREGDHWPLSEDDITQFCDVDLTDAQRDEFFSYITNGKVTKREESADSGDSGPWLFIYWNGDKDEYQVYSFESYAKQKEFEAFSESLIK